MTDTPILTPEQVVDMLRWIEIDGCDLPVSRRDEDIADLCYSHELLRSRVDAILSILRELQEAYAPITRDPRQDPDAHARATRRIKAIEALRSIDTAMTASRGPIKSAAPSGKKGSHD